MTAPKITESDIESLIRSEYCFTAQEALGVEGRDFTPLSKLTICVLVLKNGFTVTGESAPVCIENFDMKLGRKYAREAAVGKLWMLEGYLLRQRLHEAEAVEITEDRE